jgi:hypothetical protein
MKDAFTIIVNPVWALGIVSYEKLVVIATVTHANLLVKLRGNLLRRYFPQFETRYLRIKELQAIPSWSKAEQTSPPRV